MWQQQILQRLEALRAQKGTLRIAVLGIGNELYGDDALGVEIARSLIASGLSDRVNYLVIVGGPAPENHCSTLRRFKPDLVILIDAASMNLRAGSVRWLDADELLAAPRHLWTTSLHLLIRYIQAELKSEVGLIGIQPEQVKWDVRSQFMSDRIQMISAEIVAAMSLFNCETANGTQPLEIANRKRTNHAAENPIQI
ncbi:MAG: hydrogenase maturation protease [Anaerolineales bacterium]|nr:hydrogenase maturation protease [Anaerolineales bacterium]